MQQYDGPVTDSAIDQNGIVKYVITATAIYMLLEQPFYIVRFRVAHVALSWRSPILFRQEGKGHSSDILMNNIISIHFCDRGKYGASSYYCLNVQVWWLVDYRCSANLRGSGRKSGKGRCCGGENLIIGHRRHVDCTLPQSSLLDSDSILSVVVSKLSSVFERLS